MLGAVPAEGDAPAMARSRKYSDELRERAVRLYFRFEPSDRRFKGSVRRAQPLRNRVARLLATIPACNEEVRCVRWIGRGGSRSGALGGDAMAAAGGMHPALAAKLAGMGEHGIVNLQSKATKGQLCWTFDVMTKGITGASIRDAARHDRREARHDVQEEGLRDGPEEGADLIESKPGSYSGLGRHEGPPRRPARQAVRRHGAHVARGDGMSDDDRRSMTASGSGRRIGRGVFLATVAGGVSSLVGGTARLEPRVQRDLARRVARPARPHERLADLHRRGLDADASTRRRGGSRSAGSSTGRRRSTYDELRSLPKAEQVSTFHCVTGWTVEERPLGRRARLATCSPPAQPRPRRTALRVRLGGEAVRRLADARAGAVCPT